MFVRTCLTLGFLSFFVHSVEASPGARCVGEAQNTELSFSINPDKKLILTHITKALCEERTSIESEKDQVRLMRLPRFDADIERYGYWNGQWGFEVELPDAVVYSSEDAPSKFLLTFRFVVNTGDESDYGTLHVLKCEAL